MDNLFLAQKIRSRRKQIGLTQKDLSAGICTQAQISNIEKGELSPSSLILFQISKKLMVDMNYFFDIEEYSEEDEVSSIKTLIRKYIRQRDYQSLEYIIRNEKDHHLFKDKKNQQFLLWHEAICDYYLKKKDFLSTIEKLKAAIQLTVTTPDNYNEREIEILNSIAIIYNEEKNNLEAINTYKLCLNFLDLLPNINNKNIKIRILYGISKCLTDMGNFEESLNYCKKGEELCLEYETLYLLGEMLYQSGNNLIKMNNYEAGFVYWDKSITIFEIQKNYLFSETIIQEKGKIILV